MPTSPSPTPPVRRRRMTDVQRTACELVLEHGYDGFTMTELAAAAGVSRRTLFNYFPDKQSAVLGCAEPEQSDATAAFRSGGPTGKLRDDLLTTLEAVFAEEFGSPSAVAEHHRLVERAIASDTTLRGYAFERFEHIAQLFADIICEREGWPSGDLRGRVFAASFMGLVKIALDELVSRGDETEFLTVFREVLSAHSVVHNTLS